MDEPEPTKANKPESPTGQDETTDRVQQSTAGFEAGSTTTEPPTFGDYDLIAEIARGGMGVVYKARQKSLNRIVALKMIKSGEFANQEQVDRFYKEAEAAANLDHPGIVPVHEVGEVDGQHYFTMGFVDGESLAVRLRSGPLPPKEAARYAKSIAEAVAFAHSKRVIHRDLKPGNVLITKAGTLRITDFGLAKRIEEDSDLTSTGQVLGTPSYMPPEQAEGKLSEIGPAADMYALGATLYCMLVGRPPFQAANLIETLNLVLESEPVSLTSINSQIPQDLDTLCLKCLEKKPSNRYESADELVTELGRFLNGEPIQARPVGKVEQGLRWCKRKPALASALGLMFILSIGGPWLGVRQTLLIQENAVARADALLNASPAAITVFLSDIDRDISIVESRLRELSSTNLSPSQRLRLSLALLPSDPSQLTYLNDRLNDCTYEELAIVLERMKQNHGRDFVPDLWEAFQNQVTPVSEKFRAGIALASLDPDSDQWLDEDYQFLAASMLQENTVYQPEIRQALGPIAAKLIEPVKEAFHDELASDTVLESAANSIVELGRDDSELLTELSMVATPEQHSILYPEVAAKAESDEPIIAKFSDVTKLQPLEDYNEAQRIALGKRRAGAAINLLRMDQPDASLEVLRVKDDPESLTQFVHGCKDRGVAVTQLLDVLSRATEVTERYGLLLALGEFPVDTIPIEIRDTWVDHVQQLYANDPSSGIHGASGWLLRQWGLTAQAKAIDEREVPFSGDREWFTLKIDINGLGELAFFTFVIFPAGDYYIGSQDHELDRDSSTEHRRVATITRPFAVLDREIIRGEIENATGFSGFTNDKKWQADRLNVNAGNDWYLAVHFCRNLTRLRGLGEREQAYIDPTTLDRAKYPPDMEIRIRASRGAPKNWPLDLDKEGFRLPTSAEWEIACRGGTMTTFGFGCDHAMLKNYGWCEDGTENPAHHPRELRPSLRGLFDMHGNIFEWCHDRTGGNTVDMLSDPLGPSAGETRRVLRGGGWRDDATLCRSAFRYFNEPSRINLSNGFRIAVSLRVPSTRKTAH